jgi:hypothetical protein
VKLTPTEFQGGRWQGLLTGTPDEEPKIVATFDGQVLPGLTCDPLKGKPGSWHVEFVVPNTVLGDGARSVLISAEKSEAPLAVISISCGGPPEDDLRSEVSLLRAELELLKKAFRRHAAKGN